MPQHLDAETPDECTRAANDDDRAGCDKHNDGNYGRHDGVEQGEEEVGSQRAMEAELEREHLDG